MWALNHSGILQLEVVELCAKLERKHTDCKNILRKAMFFG